MEMPLGSILRLLKQSGKMGSLSLGRVYQSAEELEDLYLNQSQLRTSILTPPCFSPTSQVRHTPLLRRLVAHVGGSNNWQPLFGQTTSGPFGSSFENLASSSFTGLGRKEDSIQTPFGTSGESSNYSSSNRFSYTSNAVEGYVKGATTYMILDDLTIKPSSTISSINVFNTQGIKDMGTLQEMIVQVDSKKALELVRAAFQSSTVLTDVFLGKDGKIKRSI